MCRTGYSANQPGGSDAGGGSGGQRLKMRCVCDLLDHRSGQNAVLASIATISTDGWMQTLTFDCVAPFFLKILCNFAGCNRPTSRPSSGHAHRNTVLAGDGKPDCLSPLEGAWPEDGLLVGLSSPADSIAAARIGDLIQLDDGQRRRCGGHGLRMACSCAYCIRRDCTIFVERTSLHHQK